MRKGVVRRLLQSLPNEAWLGWFVGRTMKRTAAMHHRPTSPSTPQLRSCNFCVSEQRPVWRYPGIQVQHTPPIGAPDNKYFKDRCTQASTRTSHCDIKPYNSLSPNIIHKTRLLHPISPYGSLLLQVFRNTQCRHRIRTLSQAMAYRGPLFRTRSVIIVAPMRLYDRIRSK